MPNGTVHCNLIYWIDISLNYLCDTLIYCPLLLVKKNQICSIHVIYVLFDKIEYNRMGQYAFEKRRGLGTRYKHTVNIDTG